MSRFTRRGFLATAGMAALAGCSAVGSRVTGGSPVPTRTPDASATPTEGTPPSTLTPGGSSPPVADRLLPLPSTPQGLRDRAVSGGPGKDGIPSIEEPSFVSASGVGDWLSDDDVVFGLARGDEVKAYPQSILVWHEICNDRVGGEPVSITYCPLTGTAIGFERGDTSFGVSGRLVNNNLIMYDRETQHWWPQVLATSIPSPWTSAYATRSLRDFRLVWTTWGRWKSAHPDTQVLSRSTGYIRNYSDDPYGSYTPERRGYYRPGASPMFASLNADPRYEPKRVVLGGRTPDGAIAFLKDGLREAGIVRGDLAGTPHVAVYDPELDTGYVYRNPEGVELSSADGVVTTGDGEAHAPDALPLPGVHAFDAMWFAWIGFYPESAVYE